MIASTTMCVASHRSTRSTWNCQRRAWWISRRSRWARRAGQSRKDRTPGTSWDLWYISLPGSISGWKIFQPQKLNKKTSYSIKSSTTTREDKKRGRDWFLKTFLYLKYKRHKMARVTSDIWRRTEGHQGEGDKKQNKDPAWHPGRKQAETWKSAGEQQSKHHHADVQTGTIALCIKTLYMSSSATSTSITTLQTPVTVWCRCALIMAHCVNPSCYLN